MLPHYYSKLKNSFSAADVILSYVDDTIKVMAVKFEYQFLFYVIKFDFPTLLGILRRTNTG